MATAAASIVHAELRSLMTVLRKYSRWSNTGYTFAGNVGVIESPIIVHLRRLSLGLAAHGDLSMTDPMGYLQPFLDIISSEITCGPITGAALSSLYTFITTNLIQKDTPKSALAINAIVDATTHCKFVATDSKQDEVVLLKILEVLVACVKSDIGYLIGDESICEVVQSCFRVSQQKKMSDVLRYSAEKCLCEVISMLFTRSKDIQQPPDRRLSFGRDRKYFHKDIALTTDLFQPDERAMNYTTEHQPQNGIVLTLSTDRRPPLEENTVKENEVVVETDHPGIQLIQETDLTEQNPRGGKNTIVNSLGVTFKYDESSPGYATPNSYGVTCLFDVFQFISNLIGKDSANSPSALQLFGLQLLNLALETGRAHIQKFPAIVSFIQEEVCHQLIQLGATNDLSVLAFCLRAILNLYCFLKDSLKIQIEGFLSEVYLDILQSKESPVEKQEVVLESLLQLCQIPNFMLELFLNYDASAHSTNLYEELCEFLYKNSMPVRSQLHPIHILSLECLIAIVASTHERCRTHTGRGKSFAKSPSPPPDVAELVKLRAQKKILTKGASLFNKNPTKGVKYLQENGVFSTPWSASDVAEFLRNTPALSKEAIGTFLGEPGDEHISVMKSYVNTFDFSGMSFDSSLRMFLESFRLPGEAQKIDRIMDAFSERFYAQCPSPFANASAAYVLAFSAILLNTDHHNSVIKKKMTLAEFMRNTSGINDGKDLPSELLVEIYNSITTNEIKLPGRVREEGGASRWDEMMNRARHESKFRSIAPNEISSVPYFDKEMFLIISKPIVAALSIVYDAAEDATLLKEVTEGITMVAEVAANFECVDVFDSIIMTLCKHSTLIELIPLDTQISVFGSSLKARLSTQSLFSLIHKFGDVLREGWRTIVECLLRLHLLNLLPKTMERVDDFLAHGTRIVPSIIQAPAKPQKYSFLSTFSQYLSLNVDLPVDNYQNMEAEKLTRDCINSCLVADILPNTRRLSVESVNQLIRALIAASTRVKFQDQPSAVFFLDMMTSICILNRDRSTSLWHQIGEHFSSIFTSDTQSPYLVERATVCLLRIAIRLVQKEDIAESIFKSLSLISALERQVMMCLSISEQIAAGVLQLIQTQSKYFRKPEHWSIVLALLIKVADHPTAYACAFEAILHIIQDTNFSFKQSYQEAVETLLMFAVHPSSGSTRTKKALDACMSFYLRIVESPIEMEPLKNPAQPIHQPQILNVSFTKYLSSPSLKRQVVSDRLKSPVSESDCQEIWLPVLKFFSSVGLRSSRMDVRLYSVSLLHRILLSSHSESYSPAYTRLIITDCLLFLVNGLVTQEAPFAHTFSEAPKERNSPLIDEVLQRSYELLTKTFLHFLSKIVSAGGAESLWFQIVSTTEAICGVKLSESLMESVHERLKNVVFVLSSQHTFADDAERVWSETWKRVDVIYPQLRDEMSRLLNLPDAHTSTQPATEEI